MELVITESRIAAVNDRFLAYLRALGNKWGTIWTGWGWSKLFSTEHDQALGDRKFHIL